MSKNIKIVLVDIYVGGVPSLGLAYIAAYLREKLNICDIKILQKNFYPALADEIIKSEPDIVGYFTLTVGLDRVYKIIEEVAIVLPRAAQIMGGPHITAMPKSLSLHANVGVMGEGEETMSKLVSIFQNYGTLPVSELHKTEGIVFYDSGVLIQTNPAPVNMDLDSFPKPARDLLNVKGYFNQIIL